MGNCSGSGRGGSGNSIKIKEGGGFSYTSDNRTYTFIQKNGATYNVSDVSAIPEKISDTNATELAKRLDKKGVKVTVLSPADMEKRRKEYRAEREKTKNIDYELGLGVPWNARDSRRTARNNRLTTRMQRR